MWVLMTDGAVSIVKFNHAAEGDDRTMQVRSRRKEWLQGFSKYMDVPVKFIHSTDKDYSWRFFATPEQVAAAVGKAALDIDYSNFKNATNGPERGLKSVKLRGQLHSAYHKIWSTLLDAGDGTSLYDHKWTSTYQNDAGTIEICFRLGHWWDADKKKCQDCDTPNPYYPANGPTALKPSKAAVKRWWKAHPEVKRPVATTKASTPAPTFPAGTGKDSKWWLEAGASTLPPVVKTETKSVPCGGSYMHAAKGTLDIKGGIPTGECTICGQTVRLTLDTWAVKLHEAEVASMNVGAGDPDYTAEENSLTVLRAARDAAQAHFEDLEDQDTTDPGSISRTDLDNAEANYIALADLVIAREAAEAIKNDVTAEDIKANA